MKPWLCITMFFFVVVVVVVGKCVMLTFFSNPITYWFCDIIELAQVKQL